MRLLIIIGFIAALGVSQAAADEPVRCDKFKWPLAEERALLTASDALPVGSGDEIAPPLRRAVTIKLRPQAEVKLPMASERSPRPNTKAGFVRIGTLQKAGPYRITLSAGGWIDVVQGGRYIKSGAFSGALGCAGVRKSVTFDLAPGPMIVQFSGVPTDSIGMVMTPAAP